MNATPELAFQTDTRVDSHGTRRAKLNRSQAVGRSPEHDQRHQSTSNTEEFLRA